MKTLKKVINAAGKLTALGGSAQSDTVAEAQARAAKQHVELANLRKLAGVEIASITGAENACITTGAAAGMVISIAALITGKSLTQVQQLPLTSEDHGILLQAGHAINFGASIEQMITMAGAIPMIIGDTNLVSQRQLREAIELNPDVTGFLYVQSHHCVQDNMVSLEQCIEVCKEHGVPVIVDAAAEEDLSHYIEAGADLVTYSGGKAFCGPTVGFIAGKQELIEACELQFNGIARTMKVGKEAIFGLLQALQEYQLQDSKAHADALGEKNSQIINALQNHPVYQVSLKDDEAGRPFQRVAISGDLDIHQLAKSLAAGDPSIRTRNHHLDQGYLLIDPRELHDEDVPIIIARLLKLKP